MSKGEELIATILKQENIKFEREKTFQDLRKGKYRWIYVEGALSQNIMVSNISNLSPNSISPTESGAQPLNVIA